MFIAGFPAAVLGTNCYVASAEGPGGECVIIDPGIGVFSQLAELLAEHRLRPTAVLMTHGHFDHTSSAAACTHEWDIPAYLHPADMGLLTNPTEGMSINLAQLLGSGMTYEAPEGVHPLEDGQQLSLAGIEFIIDHVPGHTGGSSFFRTLGDEELEPVCFTGDVLFAGSIGRTDLPGGDSATMTKSLRSKVLTLDDKTIVLPGHGEATTIGRERVSNPFLTGLGVYDARRTGF